MQPNANNNVMGNASQAAPRTVPQAAPANQNVNMMAGGSKPKNNKGMMIGMIILAILAAGGIGFGVWAFLSGNQKEAKLNEQVSELQNQLTEQQATVDETVININDEPVDDAADYIYVGEWGIKINKPVEWRSSVKSYSYSNDYPQAVDTLTVAQISESPNANILMSNIGSKACEEMVLQPNETCMNIGGDNYTIMVNDAVTEDFKSHFMDINNYSKI